MDSNGPKKTSHAMPLPDEAGGEVDDSNLPNPAADLIRRKVEAAYATEPDAATAALDVAELGPAQKLSKHQKFIYELTSSGKSLPEIQSAWHEYYTGLSDIDKHQAWQEFYSAHAQASGYAAPSPAAAEPQAATAQVFDGEASPQKTRPKLQKRSLGELKRSVMSGAAPKGKLTPKHHFQSLLFGLGVGAIVMLLTLFSFFNERFIAPFIQPSRTVSNTPIISTSTAVGSQPKILIPKINLDVPVVYGVSSIKEDPIQTALERGVVHYADTAVPGQNGNVVIVGHSSNNIFNRGKYKFAFVLLSRLESRDVFYLEKDGQRYTYEVYEKKVVKPTDVSVLAVANKPATATLITCDPPGTSTNRLVVVGQQISPNPVGNYPQVAQNELATSTELVPGNSQSLWSRLFSLLFG